MTNLIKDLFYRLGVYNLAKRHLTKPYSFFVGVLFKTSSKKAITSFCKIMEANNIKFWLEFGTLLGAVRENSIMSHDNDIDIAIDSKYLEHELANVLEESGFRLTKRATLLTGEVIEETYKYNMAHIDLFYSYTDSENRKIHIYDYQTFNGLSPNECIKQYGGLKVFKNILSDFGLEKGNIYNTSVLVPDNTEEHLSELYGDDFMIPNKNWSLSYRNVRYETNKIAFIEFF